MAALAFASFIFQTTEFVPIGLLTLISEDFQMNPADTGYVMTFYAWTVAAISLPLTIATAKIDRKKLIIALFLVFIASHYLVFRAPNYESLLAARLGVAASHALFWAIAVPLAVRVAPENSAAKAIGALIAGGSIAAVLGVPGGSFLGKEFGWRVTFAVIGAVSAAVMFALWRLLPSLPAKNSGSLRSLPVILRRPAVLWVYAMIAIVVSGEFTAYIYVGPFFEHYGFDKDHVNLLLLAAGGAGLLGSYLYGRFGEARPAVTLIAPLVSLTAILLLLRLAASSMFFALAASLVWGTVVVMIFMSLQAKLLNAAKDAADVANSIYSSIFNVGIGAGAFIGSLVSLSTGAEFVGYAGSAILFCSLLLCLPILRSIRLPARAKK